MVYSIRLQLNENAWTDWIEVDAITSTVAAEVFAEENELENTSVVEVKGLGSYMIYVSNNKTEYWATYLYS